MAIFAVSYSKSQSGSAKIHAENCHNVRKSSQEGDIKWVHGMEYATAKKLAQKLGNTQPEGWKKSYCCMGKYNSKMMSWGILSVIIFGLPGGIIAYLVTKHYFGKWAKAWIVVAIISRIIFVLFLEFLGIDTQFFNLLG